MTTSAPLPKRKVWPFVVVDQNCLRDVSILGNAITHAHGHSEYILLIDMAIIEMTKSDKWEYTMTKSLELLSRHSEVVVVSHCVGELLRRETSTGIPCDDIVDDELTPRVRALLNDIRRGGGAALSGLKTTVPGAKIIAQRQQLRHDDNKKTLEDITKAWKHDLAEDTVRRLRRGDRGLFQSILYDEKTTAACAKTLERAGIPNDSARVLATQPSVSSHQLLCLEALGLKWLAQGGLDSMLPDRVTNDVCDLDYILMATFCKNIITKEARVNELYKDLLDVIAHRWRRLHAAELRPPEGSIGV